MKSPIAKCLVLVAFVGMCAATANAETLEEVKKKIHDKVSGYKSLEYKGYATTDFNTKTQFPRAKTRAFLLTDNLLGPNTGVILIGLFWAPSMGEPGVPSRHKGMTIQGLRSGKDLDPIFAVSSPQESL